MAITRTGHGFESGRALPHSKTLARVPKRHAFPPGFGVRQCSAALPFFILFIANWIFPAGAFQESFSSDPAMRGWRTFGDTNLFHWNSTNQNLEVTWDS